jgi:hypothetical protein
MPIPTNVPTALDCYSIPEDWWDLFPPFNPQTEPVCGMTESNTIEPVPLSESVSSDSGSQATSANSSQMSEIESCEKQTDYQISSIQHIINRHGSQRFEKSWAMEPRKSEIVQRFLFKASAAMAFPKNNTARSGSWLMIVQNLQQSLYSGITVGGQPYFSIDRLSRLHEDEASTGLFIEYLTEIAKSFNYSQMVPSLRQMCN